ncbi:MAG: hypothetical protein O9331_00675, partial [Acidovorax sp.]|nr:hypothetical protein [Acidovorax sp.]
MEYNQPTKVRVRAMALSHAVELLTTRRENAAVVPKSYVTRIQKTLSERKGTFDAYVAASCDEHLISEWEAFWLSKVGAKAPSDLTVAYLAGPEPLNDFRELVKLGVHPHNIFGFESETKEFNQALAAAKSSEFPLLKIIKMPLDRYLQAVPGVFDIIYFDACGPFPSPNQRTLRTVATIFRYQRLNPLSVLITNFAGPDSTNTALTRSFADLVSAYLYPRAFHESGDPKWNMKNGPVAYGLVPKDLGSDDSFFDIVLDDLPRYYGNFITRQLFDLGSFIVPLARLASGGNAGLWGTFFAKSPEEIARLAAGRKTFDAEGYGGDYIVDSGMNALGWTFSALLDQNDAGDYPTVDSQSKSLAQTWVRELGGAPETKVRDAIDAYFLLKNLPDASLLKPVMQQLLNGYRYLQNMHMFCDVPTHELALFPVMAQFSFPYHYNVEETLRYRYVAEGKSTEMFLDVIPFDTCRYIYDWLPSTELVSESFNLTGHQLVYRFALDALLKHAI